MALSRHYPGICLEGLRKIANIEYPVLRQRFEFSTFLIQVYSVTTTASCSIGFIIIFIMGYLNI
jgi:hypothetical protein